MFPIYTSLAIAILALMSSSHHPSSIIVKPRFLYCETWWSYDNVHIHYMLICTPLKYSSFIYWFSNQTILLLNSKQYIV